MSEFQRLHSVTDAMYLRAQQSLRTVLLREAQLRGELNKLDQNAQIARSEHSEKIGSMRSLGADILWEGWVARTRAQLNLELAKVLAQKEKNIGTVRKAFGKKTVSQKLLTQDMTANAKALRQRALNQAIEHALRHENQ